MTIKTLVVLMTSTENALFSAKGSDSRKYVCFRRLRSHLLYIFRTLETWNMKINLNSLIFIGGPWGRKPFSAWENFSSVTFAEVMRQLALITMSADCRISEIGMTKGFVVMSAWEGGILKIDRGLLIDNKTFERVCFVCQRISCLVSNRTSNVDE